MIIRSASHNDFSKIAQLHENSITTGFLSKLGQLFLKDLYIAIGKQPDTKIFVAESDGQICGFLAGTTNTNGLYKRVVLQNGYHFALILLKFIFDLRIVGMLCETLLYGFKKKANDNKCEISSELLSISVDVRFRGKGIGKRLVNELESFYKYSGIKMYKVVTFSEDQKANNFYRTCNFVLHKQFVHHGNMMNEYMKEI